MRRHCMFVLRTSHEPDERELRRARLKIRGAGGIVLQCIAGTFLVEGPPDLGESLAKVLPAWRCTANFKSTRLPEHSLRPWMRR
jgi:hypothetical protein